MELETLKSIWKEEDSPPETETGFSTDALQALLHKRSGGPIARMRRNLRIEALLMIIVYIPCILFYWIAFGGRMSGISWLLIGLIVFFFAYYYRKNRLLKKMQCLSCEVRSNLAGQLVTLQKYVRFYFWSSTLVVPVASFFSLLIAIRSQLPGHPHFSWRRATWFLAILVVLLTAGVYCLNKWYINKLYGRHVRRLQELLRELDEY